MNSKPKIGVKDICSLLGISPSAIRLYERYLNDRRYEVSDSGYRQFDSASFVQLYDMRFLSKCEITVQEAAKACQSNDYESKMSAYLRGEHALRAKRDYYNAALHQLNEAKSLLLKVRTLKDSFEYIDRPGFWYLECEENGSILSDPQSIKLIKEWIDAIPVAYFVHRVSMEMSAEKEWSYYIGLAIPERHAHLLNVEDPRVRYIPPQTCLATTAPDEGSESTRSQGFEFSKKVLGKGLRFLEQENHTLSGEIFSRLIVTNLRPEDASSSDADFCDYYYITYPIA